jgi:hypothetical protein
MSPQDLHAMHVEIADRMAAQVTESMAHPLSAATIALASTVRRDGVMPHQMSDALGRDAKSFTDAMVRKLRQAIVDGYQNDLVERVKSMGGYSASVSEADRRTLSTWPILGHSPATVANKLASDLVFQAWVVISAHGGDVETFGPKMDELGEKFAQSAGEWASNAYFAGVQASALEVSATMVQR